MTAAFIQLVIWVIIGVIYLTLIIFEKLANGDNEFEEFRKGNVAVAPEMAGVIVTFAVIIQSSVLESTTVIL
jgi:uncharacterized membrane protein YjfL (UPF0719 family)